MRSEGAPRVDPTRVEELTQRARGPSDDELRRKLSPFVERAAQAIRDSELKVAPSHLAPPVPHATTRFVGMDFGALAKVMGLVLVATGATTGAGYHLAEFGTAVTAQSISDTMHLVWQTLTTVGYGDVPPKTHMGRLWTHFFGTLGIIATTAEIGLAVSAIGHVTQLKKSGQYRRWFKSFGGARNTKPVVVLGGPKDPERATTFFRRLLDDLRVHDRFVNQPVVFINQAFAQDELPEDLQRRGALAIRGLATRSDDLKAAGIEHAQAVVVLSGGDDNDASALHAVAAVRALRPDAKLPVIAEVQVDRPSADGPGHLDMFRAHGATPIPIFRASSMFGGELVAPGSVDYYRRMMSPFGERIEFVHTGAMLAGKTWREIASSLASLGVPLAYRDSSGALHRPSDVDAPLHDVGHLYFAVSDGAAGPTEADVAAALGTEAPAVAPQRIIAPDQPVVLLNAPDNLSYLLELVDDVRRMPAHSGRPISIVSDSFEHGLPDELKQRGVELIPGDGTDEACLKAAGIEKAHAVCIMTPDFDNPENDGRTYMTAVKVKQYTDRHSTMSPRVLAEVVRFDKDPRVDLRLQLGRMGLEVVPALRGEPVLPGALNSKGSVDVLAHYLAPERGLMRRVAVTQATSWRELQTHLAHLGTPLQVIDGAGESKAPPANVDAPLPPCEILIAAHSADTGVTSEQVREVLSRVPRTPA